MVEVFKTNIQEDELAKLIAGKILVQFPHCKINFDLEDCDKILRVEGHKVRSEKIIEVVHTNGYQCQVLE